MKEKYKVLGINYGHDSSAALGIGEEIIAACEQERYDLKKHSTNFPIDAINDCLNIAKIKINNLDEIALSMDFDDLVKKNYIEPALKNQERLKFLINDIDRIKIYVNIENFVRRKLKYRGKITTYRHHLCHLASTYYPSGFNKALLFSNDGSGEYENGMLGVGNNGKIFQKETIGEFADSLGLIYAAITFFLGWRHHCDEGIIMGLAPFGDPHEIIAGQKSKTYIQVFRDIIKNKNKLSYEINKDWIAYHIKRDTWVSEKFKKMFGKVRKSGEKINQHHKNIAAALQLRLEEVVLDKLKFAKKKYGTKKLCIAGGVGLNCSLNGKILNSKIFDEIFVQPASGDSGVALGAVYAAMAKHNGKLEIKERYNHYLGSRFNDSIYLKYIKKNNVKYSKSKKLYEETAKMLSKGKIVGWFQGAAEFGPRALGNRSILCKPYPSKMKDYLNKRIKFREMFRPFAPAVLIEETKKYFEINQKSPHMLIACKVNKKVKNKIPAVVHVDETCRVQTVSNDTNPHFYNLIKSFKNITGIPVLLNTSFNVKGQPIVNNPDQAIKTFKNTNIDVLIIGNYILKK
jgi:carbamoyltransferase